MLVATVLATGTVAAVPALPQDLRQEASKGGRLSATEAQMLEKQLAANPQSLGTRAQLLGYYYGKRRSNPRRHAEHLLWFIRNAPESEVLDSSPAHIFPMFNADGYLEAKRAWQRLVQEEPENVAILRNAASFHRRSDATLSATLLQRAEALEPSNPEWARQLARLHWREARIFPEARDSGGAARALADFERAYELSEAGDHADLMPDLALAAFAARDNEKARGYAMVMLEAPPNRRDRGDSIHYGNLVLGHVALSEDNVAEARARLLAAGRMRGSPIQRFGAPDMTLAKALLERGESETVLKYLELCFDFWQAGEERLKDWIALVEAGRIPDFGPHLMF